MPMTPGSWYLTKEHLGIQGPDAHRICANPNGYGANYPDRWNWEANARAIAALPDLIEACQELMKHLDGDDPLGGDLGHLERAIELAQNALAKAGITT
jgi:hypothetical protein